MEAAKHIIYITNWHFNPETKNPFDDSLPNIGELLKKKSEEGKKSGFCTLGFNLVLAMIQSSVLRVMSIARAALRVGGMWVSLYLNLLEHMYPATEGALPWAVILIDNAAASPERACLPKNA